MTDKAFGEYMGEQISRIRDFKEKLEQRENESITLDEAARYWVKQYAERFRRNHSPPSEDPPTSE